MTKFEQKYLDTARNIVLKHLDTQRFHVFLFGSRARETYAARTDIDIGIFGDAALADCDRAAWNAIQDDLEEAWIPYNIDLIDFFTVSNEFKTTALQNYILWNQAILVESWQPSAEQWRAGKPYKTPLLLG